MNDLLICAATAMECDLLRGHAEVLVTGVGAVNAAHALTRRLSAGEVGQIVVCGIGGAYPDTGLAVGDVACAASEIYGDLGVETADGFLDMQALGFPLVADPRRYNAFELQVFPHPRRVGFVTVNTCSGTDALAHTLARRTGGAVESMEGAAIAHVAALFEIPAGEIRGISNRTGNRDRNAWRVKEAAEAAQQELLAWMKTL